MNHRRSTSRRRTVAASGKRRPKRAVHALAAGAAIAAGTQAYASSIRFDNPAPGDAGHFDWRGPPGTETWLDITRPASDQPGEASGLSSIAQIETTGVGRLYGDSPSLAMEVGGYADVFVTGIFSGELIPSGASWNHYGYIYYEGFGSALPELVAVYLGVRFDPGDGVHYGAVGIVRDGTGLELFGWGYETRVNTPYAPFPEPGTLSLLAFGAAAVAARKRLGA